MDKKLVKQDVSRLIQGMIVGAGAILPGVSGGVLCAAFGLYMPLMQLLAHPVRELKKSWRMWLFVIIGVGVGFLGLAYGVSALLDNEPTASIAMCLFAGLVAGTLPTLFREAHTVEPGSRCAKNRKIKFVSMAVSFLLSFVLFSFINYAKETAEFVITPNFWWFGFCGVICGLSFMIPGMSFSPILIILGLLNPMMKGFTSLDFGVIIPIGLGVVAIVLTLSRLINRIFSRFYTEAYYAVIGIVISSTLMIIPTKYQSAASLIICVLVAFVGVAASYFADRLFFSKTK